MEERYKEQKHVDNYLSAENTEDTSFGIGVLTGNQELNYSTNPTPLDLTLCCTCCSCGGGGATQATKQKIS